MAPIPAKIKRLLSYDPFMKQCIYEGCAGIPEWDHAFTYAGNQIQEVWAIVPACEYHHRGPGFNKRYNQFRALQRATSDDLAKYPRSNWLGLMQHLQSEFKNGPPTPLEMKVCDHCQAV